MQIQNPLRARGVRSLGLVVVGALVLAVVAGTALTHATVPDAVTWGQHGGTWSDGHMGGAGAWGWWMALFGLLWMTGLVALPVYLVYRLTARAGPTDRTDDGALAVLEERYARGDIDDDEFDRRRARLGDDQRH